MAAPYFNTCFCKGASPADAPADSAGGGLDTNTASGGGESILERSAEDPRSSLSFFEMLKRSGVWSCTGVAVAAHPSILRVSLLSFEVGMRTFFRENPLSGTGNPLQVIAVTCRQGDGNASASLLN